MVRLTCSCILTLLLTTLSAGAADRFVSITGTDAGNACLTSSQPCRTITRAIGQATSGDTINVATGIYREGVRIEAGTTLSFLGGWNDQFTQRDARGTPTVVKAATVTTPTFSGHDRAWVILAENGASTTVSLDGFVLTGGRAVTRVPDLGSGIDDRGGG